MEYFGVILGIIAFVVALFIALLPAIIAFKRKHAYKWIILVLTLFAWTGIVWVLAFVWAIWPQDKSALDPVMGNPTGLAIATRATPWEASLPVRNAATPPNGTSGDSPLSRYGRTIGRTRQWCCAV